MQLLTLEEQLLSHPRLADHPDWRARAERALMAADLRLYELCGARFQAIWEAFWRAVPDDWLEANTWRTIAARNAALRDYLAHLPAGATPGVPTETLVAAMHAAYFNAAPDPAPALRAAQEGC